MTQHSPLHRTRLLATLALAAGLGLAACSQDKEGRASGTAESAPTVERQQAAPADLKVAAGPGPRVRMELAAGARIDSADQAELAVSARGFAISLADWLYGDQLEFDVEPLAPQMRRKLASAPPYVPSDQIGSGDGQAVEVQVSVQTPRSGVLVVTIRDSRTSYPIPASFERRAGRWQIVHLNTH